MTNVRRRLDPRYAAGEFLWYFSSHGELEMIQHYAPQYKNFAESNGKVNGAYGPRLMSQLEDILDLLKDKKTRRAVVGLYSPYDIHKSVSAKDIPCTLSWNFLFEDDKLCLIATMRSNDVWLGMPYDVFVNTCLQRFVAAYLGVEPGWYQHQVANIHLYDKHRQAATEALYQGADVGVVLWPEKEPFVCMTDIFELLGAEEEHRKQGFVDFKPRSNGFLRDIWASITGHAFQSRVLEDAYYRRHGLRWKDHVR